MGKGRLTEEEMAVLMENKYVDYVTERGIMYTPEFKHHFMEEYGKGKAPNRIFREAGFDTKMLGPKRIERAAARWRKSYEEGTLGKYEEKCIDNRKNKYK